MSRSLCIKAAVSAGALLVLTAFASAGDAPLVTSAKQLPPSVGKIITIRGLIENTKIAQILGVDVESSSPDLRGKNGQATGRLEQWTVTMKDIKERSTDGAYPNRGPGTFYQLVNTNGTGLAQVQPVP